MILECTHAVWDFSGLQPHVVSLLRISFFFSRNVSHVLTDYIYIHFAERWEGWAWNFQEQDWKQRRRQGPSSPHWDSDSSPRR